MNAKNISHVCLLAAVSLLGCDSNNSAAVLKDGPSVQILYLEKPLANVCIRLHEHPHGAVIDQATSRHDGRAIFMNLPAREPAHYFVSMESVSDGSWHLAPPTTQRVSDTFRLQPFSQLPEQTIRLPRGAVRSLTPNQR